MGRFNPNTAVGIENANDDQRTRPGTNTNPGGGEKGSHIPSGAHSVNDAKDNKAMKDRLQMAKDEAHSHKQTGDSKHDPTQPAINHGNNPSKGAQIDKELMQDDELRMKQKGGLA